MSYSILSFYTVGLQGQLSGQVVASSQNPIYRIAFQIQVFLSGSFMMMILDFYFLGLTYIIVYVGAIMILFLFVIMMVQIHQTPVSLSASPRVEIDNLGFSGAVGPNSVNGYGHKSNDLSSQLGNRGFSSLQSASIRSLVLIVMVGFVFYFIFSGQFGQLQIVNYFYPSWWIEFRSLSDLETQANILYLGYPQAQIQVGVALWVVLIGIIKVTMSDKTNLSR